MYKLRKIFAILLFTSLMGFLIWFVTKDILRSLAHEDQHRQSQKLASNLSTSVVELKTPLKDLLRCHDKPLFRETLQYGNFWVVQNLIRGRRSIDIGCAESITYTTHGDFRFMGHLGTVVKRWLGPISFALFAPGYDFNDTMEAIQYARNCLPESQLIRDYVSFHVYFPSEHEPYDLIPPTEEDALRFHYDCQDLIPYEDIDPTFLYRSQTNLTYPINVGRNIARKAANTYFVFPCDIELYPSLGLIDQFLRMAAHNASWWQGEYKPRVFPLPVFELQSNASLPDTKTQLVAMLRTKEALPFHEMYCKYCNFVPEQDKWVEAKVGNELEIFTVAKRQGKAEFWEPFYISDNKEPEFDERVPWEGLTNKRIQNYAMCLLDYEYHILHPAFLVHSPGIAKLDPNSEKMKFVQSMNAIIVEEIVPGYQILFGRNKNCVV